MTIPDATITVKDGALGLSVPQTTNVVACVGVSSAGTANAVLSFAPGQVDAVKTALGTGPLAEEACLLVQAGVSVVTCKTTTTTPGSAAAVSPGAGNTGLSVMTISGTPLDSYELLVLMTRGGTNPAANTAAFKVSLDGGLTYGREVAMPSAGSYVLADTGLTLAFSAASLVAGDTYASACSAPVYSSGDLGTALTALFADPRTWFLLDIVGIPADSSGQSGIFSALDTAMAGQAAVYRFARCLMSGYDGNDAAQLASLAALASSSLRVGIGVGFERITSAINGAQRKRSVSTSVAKRLGLIPPSEDAGRVASGSVGETTALLRDENVTPGLDAAGACTMRTLTGLPGYFITSARLKVPGTSDFQLFQHGRVMDIASMTTRVGMLRFLNDTILVNASTGFILESEARRIEAYVNGKLRDQLTRTNPVNASDVSVFIHRDNNIISTAQILADVRVTPVGYARGISTTIAFNNPALQPTA